MHPTPTLFTTYNPARETLQIGTRLAAGECRILYEKRRKNLAEHGKRISRCIVAGP
jgi:hypothetical protein